MAAKTAASVLMIIAHHNFRDEEYLAVRKQLEAQDAKITVASTVTRDANGYNGLEVDPDLLIDDVRPEDYDAFVFIGGSGASQYWHDVMAHNIAVHAARTGKLIAAASHAPVTLGVAGLLKDKRVTGHVGVYEKLIVHGARFTGSKLEVDGNIITASGANAARDFAKAVEEGLQRKAAA